MRTGIGIGGVGTLLIGGLVIYAIVTMSLIPTPWNQAAPKDEPDVPLEQAAPEVVKLRETFRAMARKAHTLVPACRKRYEDDVLKIDGKILIWDAITQDVSDGHGRLPAELRARSADDDVTVFLITERTRTHELNYSHDIFHSGGATGVKGYRVDLTVCPINLTLMQPLGRYSLTSYAPRLTRPKPGQTEVESNWPLLVKNFADKWVAGREPKVFHQAYHGRGRAADQAKAVLAVCESMGSVTVFPPKLRDRVLIWDALRDDNYAQLPYGEVKSEKDPGLVVLVLDETFVPDPAGPDTARIDITVALVGMPGAVPMGIYTIRGRDWPAPTDEKPWTDRDPAKGLAEWVKDFVAKPSATVKSQRTILHPPGQTRLTELVRATAPGWLEKPKKPPIPKEQEGWYRLAAGAKPAIPKCRLMGPALPTQKLPPKALIWYWSEQADAEHISVDHHYLPKALQVGPADTEAVVFCVVDSTAVYEERKKGQRELVRLDSPVAVIVMPGAKPVGMYTIRGLEKDEPRDPVDGRDRSKRDWVARFMDSPGSVIRR